MEFPATRIQIAALTWATLAGNSNIAMSGRRIRLLQQMLPSRRRLLVTKTAERMEFPAPRMQIAALTWATLAGNSNIAMSGERRKSCLKSHSEAIRVEASCENVKSAPTSRAF